MCNYNLTKLFHVKIYYILAISVILNSFVGKELDGFRVQT